MAALHNTSPVSGQAHPLVVKFADGKGKVATGGNVATGAGGGGSGGLKRGLDSQASPGSSMKRANMGGGRMVCSVRALLALAPPTFQAQWALASTDTMCCWHAFGSNDLLPERALSVSWCCGAQPLEQARL